MFSYNHTKKGKPMSDRNKKRPFMRFSALIVGSYIVTQYDGVLFALGIVLLLALIADIINPK